MEFFSSPKVLIGVYLLCSHDCVLCPGKCHHGNTKEAKGKSRFSNTRGMHSIPRKGWRETRRAGMSVDLLPESSALLCMYNLLSNEFLSQNWKYSFKLRVLHLKISFLFKSFPPLSLRLKIYIYETRQFYFPL